MITIKARKVRKNHPSLSINNLTNEVPNHCFDCREYVTDSVHKLTSGMNIIIIIIGKIITPKTMFIVLPSWWSHCENSLGSCDEYRTTPSGRQPLHKANNRPLVNHVHLCLLLLLLSSKTDTHLPPTEGRRLNRPQCVVTY